MSSTASDPSGCCRCGRCCCLGFGDEWKFSGLPCGQAAGHFNDVVDAVPVEDAGGGGGAVTTGAVDGDAAVARDLSEPLLKMIERDVDAAWDVLHRPLAWIADVEDERCAGGELGVEVGGADAFGGGDEAGAVSKGGHAFVEIAAHVIEADAAEAECGFVLAAGFGDDDDGFFAVEQRSGPRGVLAAEADVEAAGEMALGELYRVADVEELDKIRDAGFLQREDFVERERLQDFFEIAVECAALARVEDGVVGEVLRSVGLVGGDE